jgi:hypothetical protein
VSAALQQAASGRFLTFFVKGEFGLALEEQAIDRFAAMALSNYVLEYKLRQPIRNPSFARHFFRLEKATSFPNSSGCTLAGRAVLLLVRGS